jgi:hypothetical protein
MHKKIMHNGYIADILNDDGVYLQGINLSGKEVGFIASPSRADKKVFFLEMAFEGAIRIEQSHSRYIVFNLRHIMSRVGGIIVDSVTYTINSDGVWMRKQNSRKGFSYDR